MKKYILIALTILITACSSDNDNFSVSNNQENKTYTVNFNVKPTNLSIEESPLKRSMNNGDVYFFQCVVYDQNGDFLLDVVYNSYTHPELTNKSIIPFSLGLPVGNYRVVFISIIYDEDISSGSIIGSDSKYTDYYIKSVQGFENTYDNEGVYFENLDLTIVESDKPIEKDVVLKPMWSNLNILIEDAQTFDVPAGTDALQFVVNPHYYGFALDTKLAKDMYPNSDKFGIVALNSVRLNSTYTFSTSLCESEFNNDLQIKINYLKTTSDSTYTILASRDLKIGQTSLQNGYNYDINGSLGSSKAPEQSMNISLGEFNKEDVLIEF